jgi:hypothetical protein
VTVRGKAAGLGNGPIAAFLTADSVSATYECVDKGGNVAPGQPVVLSNVTGPSQTITPHNGQITFSPDLPPPTPSARTECPNANWSVRLTSLTYTDVVLHIQQPPGTDVLTFSLAPSTPDPHSASADSERGRAATCGSPSAADAGARPKGRRVRPDPDRPTAS